jgi:ABC-type sugar transport system substrate-binding protein
MALGVADAVQAARRQREVKVGGCDGVPQALAAVRRGSLSATVAQYPYTMGQLAIEACLTALRGDPCPPPWTPRYRSSPATTSRARANFPEPVEHFDDAFAR